jgi:hypothetical protein
LCECFRKQAARIQLDEIARKAAEAEANRGEVNEDGGAAQGKDADGADRLGVHAVHRKKRGTIWNVFDLSKEIPTLTLLSIIKYIN